TKDQSIIAENRPTRVCLDVCWKGTLTSVWEVQHTITTSRTLTNYVKDGIQHYVFALAIIDAAGNVTDLRQKGSQAERRSESTLADALADHERSRNHPDATLDAKGFTQLSSATDSESESLAATPKAVKRAMDNASARLAKDRNGDDIPDKDLFARNISAALAYGAEVDTLRGGSWTTEEFIDWLETRGAFNHPYWMCRTGWNTLNKIITDTGCGDVQLCDTVIEVMGNRSALTIRITTSGKGTKYGLNSAQFIYTRSRYSNDGHWRRDLCRSGDTMDGELKLRGPDALRIFDDAFGVVFRRSDDCLYLIPTVEGKGENGAAGGLRPFIINLKTGKVSMKNGTDVEGALSVGGRLTVGSEIAIGNSPLTGFKNNAGSLEVYCNNNHIFLFKNGILESYKPVNISGRVTPSDYGNFDTRYSRKTETVQDIRYGSEIYYDRGENETSWILRAPSGYVLSGINVQDTGTGSADKIVGVWCRPLQKNINGIWYNVGSV
ncbi:phage tail protein, partial [Escherichia coli]|nr:phage tail protein [Escherichia coli]